MTNEYRCRLGDLLTVLHQTHGLSCLPKLMFLHKVVYFLCKLCMVSCAQYTVTINQISLSQKNKNSNNNDNEGISRNVLLNTPLESLVVGINSSQFIVLVAL